MRAFCLARHGNSTSSDILRASDQIPQPEGISMANIIGTAGNDDGIDNPSLVGTSDSDRLDGLAGADIMDGGAGDDTYVVDNDGDTIIDEGGSETIESSITYTLANGLENITLTGSAHINATGNAAFNTIRGNSGNNILVGGGGRDVIYGYAGNDTLSASSDSSLYGGDGSDTLSTTGTFGGLYGDAGNDNLSTGSILNSLYGGDGDDILTDSSSGAGTLGNNLSGDTGNDTLSGNKNTIARFSGEINGFTYALSGTNLLISDINSVDGNEGSDTLSGIGRIKFGATSGGTTYRLVLGSNADNTLNGDSDGSYTSDLMIGFGGTDTMIGGTGDDVYVVAEAADLVTEFEDEGNDTLVTSALSLDLANYANIENIILTGSAALNATGNGSNNKLTGNAGNNRLTGGAGADTLTGLSGNDTYVIDIEDIVVESSGGGTDTIQAGFSITLGNYANLENITLTGSDNISAAGDGNANTLIGNAGNNMLTGGGGNDTYQITSGDTVIEAASSGIDTILAAFSINLSNYANVENITLTGSANISAIGNGVANALTGNGGANKLDGKTGADTMLGGAGSDQYYVDNSNDRAIETSASGGSDIVYASVSFKLGDSTTSTIGKYVENLTLTGTSSISATGNSLSNTIIGNSGANTINGSLGKDALSGGKGKDSFVFNTKLGSTNIDTIKDFSAPDDTIKLENAIFTKLSKPGVLSSANFRASSTGKAKDSNDYIVYETDTGKLFYDTDGSGSKAAVQFAIIGAHPKISALDFVIT